MRIVQSGKRVEVVLSREDLLKITEACRNDCLWAVVDVLENLDHCAERENEGRNEQPNVSAPTGAESEDGHA